MGREFELKYRATSTQQQAIYQQFQDFHKISMETTYFDTANGLLAAKRVTLRLRKENDLCICTMKTPLADGSRGEWECEAEDIHKGLCALRSLGAPGDLCDLADQDLRPVCGARFTRLATQIETAECVVELALDHGVLLGGGQEMALSEVEVELKSGAEQAAIHFADMLAKEHGLVVEQQSKFRRALALAEGE